jgi:hypothetical protein
VTTLGDERYTVRKEFTGDFHTHAGLLPGQMWVVRFCGEFVAAVATKGEGLRRAAAHQTDRAGRPLAPLTVATKGILTA